MSKKIFAVIIGLFLIVCISSLLAINSFFREETRLLQEQKRLVETNDTLLKTVQALKKRIPPIPKGAVVEEVTIKPVPGTEGTEAPRYTVAFWIKNPTKAKVPAMQGLIAAQINGVLDPTRWNSWLVSIGPLASGERKSVVTNPVVLGNPGTTVEVIVTIKGQPGIGKAQYQIPDLALPAPTPEGQSTPATPKPTQPAQPTQPARPRNPESVNPTPTPTPTPSTPDQE